MHVCVSLYTMAHGTQHFRRHSKETKIFQAFFFLTIDNVWVRYSVICKQQVLLYACARICACMCVLKTTVTTAECNQCYHRTVLSVLGASVVPFLSHTFLKRIPTLERQSHFLLVPYRTLWVTRPERRLCLTWAEIIGDMISGFLCRGRECSN